jgi:hypothetical protein
MANEKLTKREEALAKRAGKGGRAFVLARRKTPGLSLLEYQQTEGDASEDLDVGTTAAVSGSTEPTRVTGPAKKTTTAKTTTPPKA